MRQLSPFSMSFDRYRAFKVTIARAVGAISVGIVAAGLALCVASEPITYDEPEQLAQLQNQKINESSGLAVSRRRPGVFWTHNDSGDQPRIYAFDHHGKDWGEFAVQGAKAIDWEDMASFEHDDQAWLLLGDVGDNGRRRRYCVLYLVEEPKDTTAIVRAARTLRFRYERGPQNCEAVAWDPSTHSFLLFTKSPLITSVYRLPFPERATDETLVAKFVADMPLGLSTAVDISADGRRAVLLTYGHAYEYVRAENETWKDALLRKPREIRMPPRRQGESICFGSDDRTLYLTSEKIPTPLWEVPGEAP